MYDPAVVRAFDAIEARIAAEPYDDAPEPAADATAHDDLAPRPAEVAASAVPDTLRESGRSALTQLLDHLFRLDPHTGVDTTCDLVSSYLRRLTPATLVVFYTHDVETEELVAAHASGYGADLLRGSSMPLGKNVSGWVAVNGRSIITDPALDSVESLSHVDPGFQSLMSVPLVADASTVGVVTLYATGENAFQDEQRQALELASAPIAETLARALEHDRSRLTLFADDELAGVASRRALDELVARDRRKRAEKGRARAVLCLKNDGRPDVMLHAMMAVSHSTRIADLIFRPTDDSLVVLMKDADAAAEQLVTARIMAALPPGLLGPHADTSSLRLGFACSPRDGEYWSDLLHAAQHRAWDRPDRVPAEPAATLPQRGLPWKA
jgi:putative methionine-R-sulfoxide reductase with GAF domain